MAARKDQKGRKKGQRRRKHAMKAPISANPAALDSKKMELLDHKLE
ncbi:hypothetical protein KW843_13380 [Acidovorax sp. sif1233]|nr:MULTISPECIES: hypothetical protein [unclassified Acidovorax]MBV7427572.1 hypothetical protein [Acidovorax sp. sif0732]MBV7449932.1 hypothetical protein [Acidovorax sp. sif0715]MBV7455468.1 hypothetical protein [Acidovorax sp. sif1233]